MLKIFCSNHTDIDYCKDSACKTVYTMQIKVMRLGTFCSRSDTSNKQTDWLCTTVAIVFIIESIILTINSNIF